MASYYPPTEDINVFNTSLFTNEPDAISQGSASLLYLSKVSTDTSTAPLTTFTGNTTFTNLPNSSAIPSSPNNLVNKNFVDITFQTIAGMASYLTIASASATYQTIAGMASYLTIASASATYQTIAGMASYLTIASASATYLTIASASATYQTIADMVNYLNTTGNTTQSINGTKTFSNTLYLNDGSRYYNSTNYTEFAQVGTQLTIKPVNLNGSLALYSSAPATGLQTQQLLINNAGATTTVLNSTNIFSINYNTSAPTSLTEISFSTTTGNIGIGSGLTSGSVRIGNSSGSSNCYIYNTLNANGMLANTPSVNQNIFTNLTSSGGITIGNSLAPITINSLTNTIGGSTTFSVIPNCAITATSANQLVNYTTLNSQGFTTLPIIQANANAWTNTNTFNSFLPTSTITATSANQLVNYTTLTGQSYTTLALVQSNANIWTNTNTFNTTLPTSTITATSANQLVNYTTLTGQSYTTLALVQSNANIWTNTNTFNTTLPTSTITATSANQLVNYTTLTGQSYTTLPLVQSNANIWTNTNTFNTTLPTSTITATTANQLVNYTTLTGQSYTTLALVQSNNNTFTANTSFNGEVDCNSWLNLKFRTRIYDVLGTGNHTQMYHIGTYNFVIGPISNSGTVDLYCKDGVGVQTLCFQSSSVANTSNSPFISNGLATFNAGAVFNSVIPTTSISATSANHIVNYTTLTGQSYTTLALVQSNNSTYTGSNIFSGDITLSRTKNNSSYATYNALSGSYIGYVSESIASTYLSTSTNTFYQVGAITFTSSNVGFYICNYEVEINAATAGSITKTYVFVADNNISTTIPIVIAGAAKNDFSTNTYTLGDSMYYSGSFTFLQSTTTVIYSLQVKIIIGSGTYERKGSIRMTRII